MHTRNACAVSVFTGFVRHRQEEGRSGHKPELPIVSS